MKEFIGCFYVFFDIQTVLVAGFYGVMHVIDGVRGSPNLATCGGIFRGSMEEFIGGFYVFFDVHTVLVAEFYGVIHVIEQTQKMGLTSLWLECDFVLVCATFIVRTNVP